MDAPTPILPEILPGVPVAPVAPVAIGRHKSTCVCKICLRARERITLGLPRTSNRAARRIERVAAETRRAEKLKRVKNTVPERARLAIERDARMEASLETQVRLGHKPNVALAAQTADVSARRGQQVAKAKSFVETALEENGITDDRLAQVGAAGLEANEVRLIVQDGVVVDAVNIPDWHGRHKYWRDLLLVKGHLGKDAETNGAGGLIVIATSAVQNETGHPAACACEVCATAWEAKSREYLAQHRRMRSIDALPESIDSLDSPTDE